jgi:hypothetical protein
MDSSDEVNRVLTKLKISNGDNTSTHGPSLTLMHMCTDTHTTFPMSLQYGRASVHVGSHVTWHTATSLTVHENLFIILFLYKFKQTDNHTLWQTR